MGKQDHTEIVLPSLQAYCGEIANLRLGQHTLELSKGSDRPYGHGFTHLGEIVNGKDSALPISKFGDVVGGSALFNRIEKSRRKALLHRRQKPAPTLRDADGRAARGQGSHQPGQRSLHARHQVSGGEQPPRIYAQS